MDRKRRNEIFLVTGLLLTALLCFAFIRLQTSKTVTTAEVSVAGEVLAAYPLDQNTDEIITGYRGGTNHLIIKDGGVSITEASCPDKVCVRQGTVKESGQTLVCLPNKVIVTIK